MSSILETKKRIITSLKVKPKTITDLSKELNLSLPTVQEHLEDLIEAGAIENIESHGKWRYYKLNPEFDIEKYTTPRLLRRKKLGYLGLILIIIIAITAFAFYSIQKSELSISCSTNSSYKCSNPKFSSGVLSLNISGFTKPTLIRSFGCSYNSSEPTNFTSINLFVYPNESAKLNLTCINSTGIVHIYIVYSVNGANNTILLNISRGTLGVSKESTSTSISTSTSSTTPTILTSTFLMSTIVQSSTISTVSSYISTVSTVTTTLSNSSSTSTSLSTTTSILNTTTSTTTSLSTTSSILNTTTSSISSSSTTSSTSTSTSSSTTSIHYNYTNTTFGAVDLPIGALFKVTYDNITESRTIGSNATGKTLKFLTISGNYTFFVYNSIFKNVSYIPNSTSGSLRAGSLKVIGFSH